MLSQISVSVASGTFSVVSLVRLLRVLLHCLFMLHHSLFMVQHVQTLLSKCQSENKEAMLFKALGFRIDETDHCSILVLETVGFFQE